ncbi:MAG TPA: extracellular solute-binding protein [Actinomycetota bacterium]|nr:extracellular solute-binding protein [Actinomycetota bacterium]
MTSLVPARASNAKSSNVPRAPGRRLVALALATLALASACTGDVGPEEDAAPRPRFTGGALLIWADEPRARALRPFADQFTRDNPGVTVRIEVVDFDEMLGELLQAGPAGTGPDLFLGAHEWLTQLVPARAVAPVNLSGVASEFLPVTTKAFRSGGRFYGVPFAFQNVALVRNTRLVPQAPQTWEELEKVALRLKRQRKAEIPLGLPVPDPFSEYPLFSAMGGYLFGETSNGGVDTDDIGLDSPGGLRAAEAFARWTRRGLIDTRVTNDVMVQRFGDGSIPFAITGPWSIEQTGTGFATRGVPFAVEPIPAVAGGEAKPLVHVQGFMVSRFAKTPLLAQTFAVEYLTTEEAQVRLSGASRRPPALRAALERVEADPGLGAFARSGRNGVPVPTIPRADRVWPIWTAAYTELFNGTKSPRKAFEDAETEIADVVGSR